ncbi:MAG: hypothetical protein AB7S54_12645 [Bacteroidales bacterium]
MSGIPGILLLWLIYSELKVNFCNRYVEGEKLEEAPFNPFDEISPFVTENGRRLFLSSNSHRSVGGFDLYFSDYENKTWGLPRNLGYLINTLHDDTFLFPLDNGKRGFISRASEESSGEDDIYEVTLDLDSILQRK